MIQPLTGVFEGVLNYDNPESNPPSDIWMSFEGSYEGGKISGVSEIKISRDGRVFSHSKGDGNIDSYKKANLSDQAIFIDLGGKMGFLQAYFINSSNTIIGNYYRQADVSDFRKAGVAVLYRK